MKKFFSISIALLLAIVINLFIPFSSPVNAVANEINKPNNKFDQNILTALRLSFGFDGSGAGIVDQYWYTKLIKLDGYNQKDVSGTLHYEIVPYYPIENICPELPTGSYDGNGKYPNYKVKVTIRKGPISRYKYDVPFSSNDFVDPKFNELCANVSSDFGLNRGNSWNNPPMEYGNDKAKTYIDLFNHAFLHEWGTVITQEDRYFSKDNNQKIYRVGKISQSHFSNLQNYLNYIKKMNNLFINWQGDPETYVTGYGSDWKNTNFPIDEAVIDRRLRSKTSNEKLLEDGSANEEHLSAYESFRDGSYKFTSLYTIPEHFKNSIYGNGLYDRLYTITRPIAISKKYDSNGNITLLEKPLFPSVSMAKFLAWNTDYYNYYYKYDHYEHIDVYRYILREKQPT